MQKLDIHDYSGRYQRALRLLREDWEISEENRKAILDFAEYCQAQTDRDRRNRPHSRSPSVTANSDR